MLEQQVLRNLFTSESLTIHPMHDYAIRIERRKNGVVSRKLAKLPGKP